MTYYVTFIRPVGSRCWTAERVAGTPDGAEKQAAEERNKKVTFADGSVHLQSTAIVMIELPTEVDASIQHFEPAGLGLVRRSVA